MSIIFLDIDGVLNSREFLHAQRQADVIHSASGTDLAALIDPVRVARLNRLVHATQATVVLSSGWREIAGMSATQKALDSNGAEFTLTSETPRLPSGDRAQEIRVWLAFTLPLGDLCPYVILDDLRPAGESHGDAFVHVPDGLEDAHVAQAMRVLGVAT